LQRDLAIAYSAVPWNTGRIARLIDDLAATEREIEAASHTIAPGESQPGLTGRRGDLFRTKRAASFSSIGSTQGDEIRASTDTSVVYTNSSHSWIGRFAVRLMQLRPSMNIGSAVQYAVTSIHHAADLDPCRAAEILVLANRQSEPLDACRVMRPRQSHATRYRTMFGARLADLMLSSARV
jgi:hypothetical protein